MLLGTNHVFLHAHPESFKQYTAVKVRSFYTFIQDIYLSESRFLLAHMITPALAANW